MGYTTEFEGRFILNKPLDEETYTYLINFADSRRMKRDVDPKYGIEGEFYTADESTGVIDYNTPPSTQPGLWCQWIPSEDHKGIEWDGNEKFYNYREWLDYIIKNFLEPKGYKLSGTVKYQSERSNDRGIINGSNPLQVKSEYAATDFLGNELEIGDEVVFTQLGYRNLIKGTIKSISPKTCIISHKAIQNRTESKQFHRQIVKV